MLLTIYFHIGESKTGTSFIQNFLDVNRKNLFSEHNCLYPNFSRRSLNQGRFHNHAFWYNTNKNNEDYLKKDIDRMIKFSINHSIQKVILSNEGWLLSRQSPLILERLLPDDENINLKAICYLRRIDYWIESAWKQWGLKTEQNFDEYITRPEIFTRYKHILNNLNKWSNFLGKENIIVRPYEKQQLENGLVSDFLNCVGIDYESNQWNDTENKNIATNAGFNRDVLEILHYCHGLQKNMHDNHLFEMFSRLLGDKFQKQPFESYALMTPEQRVNVIKNNHPYEKEIAVKYMGRKDGRIFYDPMPDPEDPYQPHEGLTLEKFVPIVIRMICQLDQEMKAKKNSSKYQGLRKKIKTLIKSNTILGKLLGRLIN